MEEQVKVGHRARGHCNATGLHWTLQSLLAD